MKNDTKHELIEALRAGAKGPARSKKARLKEIIDEVEAAKTEGLSHKQIVAILESRGLCFTLGTFEITRHRILKERQKSVPVAPVAPKASTTPAAPPTQPAERRLAHQSKSKPTAQDLKNIARRDIDLSEYDQ